MTPASHTVVETTSGQVVARDPELAAAIEAMLAYELDRKTEDDLDAVLRLELGDD